MVTVLSRSVKRMPAQLAVFTFIVDIGENIPIECIPEGDHTTSAMASLRHSLFPTSTFEITIETEAKTVNNATIEPVIARKHGQWSIFGFIIRRGNWTVTRRCCDAEASGQPGCHWVYSDDFLLLQVSCGTVGVDSMLSLFTGRLEEISKAIRAGNRIVPHAENRQRYRETAEVSITNLQKSSYSAFSGIGIDLSPGSSLQGAFPGISVSAIEEIHDTSWLFE